MIPVLYEDAQILVCIKPPGLLSVSEEESSAASELSRHREANGEDSYIGVIHRLDRGVGGVMVFAKSSQAAAFLSKEIQKGTFSKSYLTVVQGCPEPLCGTWTDLLFKDSSKNKSFVVRKKRRGVREASLEYEVLETAEAAKGAASAVRIHLQTGRTHQIRVQFSSRKHPLLGDGKYGSRENCNIALWSCCISFSHPKTGKWIEFETMPDREQYPWNLFTL